MNKMKQMWLFTALAVVASLALGYMFLVSPKKAKVEGLHTEATQQRIDNKRLKTSIDLLLEQQKGLPAEQARLAEILANIPKTPMLPTLTRALTKGSSNSGVELAKVAPKLPELSAVAAPAAAPVAADETTDAAPAAGAASGAVPGKVGRLGLVEVDVEAYGTYEELKEFLVEIEELKRMMMVTTIKVELPKNETLPLDRVGRPGDLKINVTARVFMRKTADQVAITGPREKAAAGSNGVKSNG